MKGKDVEDALIDLGVKRGVLFFRDLEDIYPADHFPVEEVENLLKRLDGMGVRVVEKTDSSVGKRRHRRKAA